MSVNFQQDKSIHSLTTIAKDVAAVECPTLLDTAESLRRKYADLWSSFAKCHNAYNAAKTFTEEEITALGKP